MKDKNYYEKKQEEILTAAYAKRMESAEDSKTGERDFVVCSGTECTGLIPAGPVREGQRTAYEELYPSLVPPVVLKHPAEQKG